VQLKCNVALNAMLSSGRMPEHTVRSAYFRRHTRADNNVGNVSQARFHIAPRATRLAGDT